MPTRLPAEGGFPLLAPTGLNFRDGHITTGMMCAASSVAHVGVSGLAVLDNPKGDAPAPLRKQRIGVGGTQVLMEPANAGPL